MRGKKIDNCRYIWQLKGDRNSYLMASVVLADYEAMSRIFFKAVISSVGSLREHGLRKCKSNLVESHRGIVD